MLVGGGNSTAEPSGQVAVGAGGGNKKTLGPKPGGGTLRELKDNAGTIDQVDDDRGERVGFEKGGFLQLLISEDFVNAIA